MVDYSGSDSKSDLPSLVELSYGSMVVGGGRDPMLDLSTQAPLSLPTSSPQHSPDQQRRNRQGEWVLDHFTGRQLLNLAAERFHREDCERQAALQRVIMDTGVLRYRKTLS